MWVSRDVRRDRGDEGACVIIAGGGPAGMMLAAELALGRVDVAVQERRPDHALVGSRAGGFHSPTVEVLDQRGVVDRFLAEGQVVQASTFGTTVLDLSDFPSRHPSRVRSG
jgi:3-(3-hydroxy-phenyl)propionate hydroxylase